MSTNDTQATFESKKSDDYELHVAKTLSDRFSQCGLNYTAEWNQAPIGSSGMVSETSNAQSDVAIKDKDGNIVTFIEAKEKYDANLFSISIGSHMFNAQWLDTKDHRFLGIRPSADFDIWRVDGTNFQKKLGKTPRMTKLKILDVIQERLNDKSEGKFNDWFFNTYIPGQISKFGSLDHMKLSDDRYEKSKKENLKKNLENVTRDIANSWKEHTGSMDIFTSGLRRCGQAVLQHYQKKNVSYVVIDDTIFLNSNTERGPNPLNIKGIKPITLIDPGLFTIRFKIDEARIVSRFNLIKTGELKKYDLKIQTMEFGK